jgi:hypothetical protein
MEVLRSLNRVQQKAVFMSLMCDQFSLIRGMPGSGKTPTIVGLPRNAGWSCFWSSLGSMCFWLHAVHQQRCGHHPSEAAEGGAGRRGHGQSFFSTQPRRWRGTATPPTKLPDCYSSYMVVATCLGVDHAAIVNRSCWMRHSPPCCWQRAKRRPCTVSTHHAEWRG